MRSVLVRRFAPFEESAIEDMPAPVPAAGEVAIETMAAEISYPDLLVIEGRCRLKDEIAALGPGGVDIIIDSVGGEARAAALRTLAWRGQQRLPLANFKEGLCTLRNGRMRGKIILGAGS